MTWKQIEKSREIRLWVTQIVVPIAVVAGTALSIPEVRKAAAAKANQIKYDIESKIKRKF